MIPPWKDGLSDQADASSRLFPTCSVISTSKTETGISHALSYKQLSSVSWTFRVMKCSCIILNNCTPVTVS